MNHPDNLALEKMLRRSRPNVPITHRCGVRPSGAAVAGWHSGGLYMGDYIESEAEPAEHFFVGEFAGWNDPLGNNWLQDCAEAGAVHGMEAYNAFARKPIPPFTQDDAVALYSDVAGYVLGNGNTDRGTYSTDLIGHMMGGKGLTCGADGSVHKWVGVCALDVTQPLQVMIGMAEFVVVYRELGLPRTAQGQQEWTVVGNPITDPASQVGSWDYHFVPYLGYGADAYYCDSWGLLIPVDKGFDATYAYRGAGGSWVAYSTDMAAKTGISSLGFNYDKFNADHRKLHA